MKQNLNKESKPSYRIELIGIISAIGIIFLIWIYYPKFVQNIDSEVQKESPKIVVQYNLDFLSGKSEIDSQFKEYGESSNKPTKIIVPFKLGLTSEKSEINDQFKKDDGVQKESSKISEHQKLDSETEKSQAESEFQKIGAKYGTYGDSYGSLNTLFSGLAFAVLIISLFMQRQELRAQREELEAQRNEIQESNAIADAQREIAEKQRLTTEQQTNLNIQQIHDAKVQNYYNQLFKYLDEKRRKINVMNDYLNKNLNSPKPLDIFDSFIDRARFDLNSLNQFIVSNKLQIDTNIVQSLISSALSRADARSYNLITESEFIEFTYFILKFIKDNENLGILEESINIFISYQSLNELFCVFLYSIKNIEFRNSVTSYLLPKKINNPRFTINYFNLLYDYFK